jgi:hypothetical protein
MKQLAIEQKDLKLKSKEDLQGMFNLQDKDEKKAFEKCVEMTLLAHKNLIKKIKDRRDEIIEEEAEQLRKQKREEAKRIKQIKKLEAEKVEIMKKLEEEKKKAEEERKRQEKLQEDKKKKEGKDSGSLRDSSAKKGDKVGSKTDLKADPKTVKVDPKATGKVDPKADPKTAGKVDPKADPKSALKTETKTDPKADPKKVEIKDDKTKTVDLKKSDEDLGARLNSSTVREGSMEKSQLSMRNSKLKGKEEKKKPLKEMTMEELDMQMREQKIKMDTKQKELEYMQKSRNLSAYKSHEKIGNVKTRRIEYLFDLKKNPVEAMKERQQKEMENMMNYEMSLQLIKKQREDFIATKHMCLMDEQQFKETVLAYNMKVLEREKEIKGLQKKINNENKVYHLQRTKKANMLEMENKIRKIKEVEDRALHMKMDRNEYQISRHHMMQKLKKDLEAMRSGNMKIQDIEKKYHFLHNDKEFQAMMIEIKKEIKELDRSKIDLN